MTAIPQYAYLLGYTMDKEAAGKALLEVLSNLLRKQKVIRPGSLVELLNRPYVFTPPKLPNTQDKMRRFFEARNELTPIRPRVDLLSTLRRAGKLPKAESLGSIKDWE